MSKVLRLLDANPIRWRVREVPVAIQEGGDGAPKTPKRSDDLSRNVFGLLGLPVDAIDFATLLHSIDTAVGNASPFLVSTSNVNFLVKSQHNREFRESILLSDLSLADGMPLIWIAKLLRVPILERIAGADLFGRLKSTNGAIRRLKVFLFGGGEGVAATVCEKLNAQPCGLECVGVLNPGFGTIEEMSETAHHRYNQFERCRLVGSVFWRRKSAAMADSQSFPASPASTRAVWRHDKF